MNKHYYTSNEDIFDDGRLYGDEDDDDDDEEEDNHEVPYSSSSSIGSIPWADDAIKENQTAWERVEQMLKGEQPPPDELELRHEIAEWQRKFPQLLGNRQDPSEASRRHLRKSGNRTLDSTPTGSFDNQPILDLSLGSLDDEDDDDADVFNDNDEYDELATPTSRPPTNFSSASEQRITPEKSLPSGRMTNLANLLERGLRITSVPLALRSRHKQKPPAGQPDILSPEPSTQHTPLTPLAAATVTRTSSSSQTNGRDRNKLYMPPILNVLESKRRFLGRPPANRSFVQLTHVQQVQSAAVTYQPPRRITGVPSAGGGGGIGDTGHAILNKSAWQLPLTAVTFRNRYAVNNRNAIVLPALQRSSYQMGAALDSGDRRRGHSRLTTALGSAQPSDSITHGWQPQSYKYAPHWTFNAATQNGVSSTTATTTSGRSISAAVHPNHQPRSQFNSAFYRPYAGGKFK